MGEGAKGARLKSSNYDLSRLRYRKKFTVSLKSPEALSYHLLLQSPTCQSCHECSGLNPINKKLSQVMFRGCLFRVLCKGCPKSSGMDSVAVSACLLPFRQAWPKTPKLYKNSPKAANLAFFVYPNLSNLWLHMTFTTTIEYQVSNTK